MKGRVIKSTGSWYIVQVGEKVISARLKGKFKQDELKLTNPIAGVRLGTWGEEARRPGAAAADRYSEKGP